jgi:two-component system response regulator YesN
MIARTGPGIYTKKHLLSVISDSTFRLACFLLDCFHERRGTAMANKDIITEIYRFVVRLPEDQISGLTIKMLAERFEVSRCHISRRFHDERGMTLTTFIQRRKLLLAERFLRCEPDLTVKCLACRLGFADYQYFILLFKEQWGESPGRYRKLHAGSRREWHTQ